MSFTELKVRQGTPEWHEARAKCFTASEAPAMMGDGWISREELLKNKKLGLSEEITPEKQRIFDKGHKAEELARPIVEEIFGVDLSPITATREVEGIKLLASSDGKSFDGTIGWEHKLWSKKVIAMIEKKKLAPKYYWQLEQQIKVFGFEKIIFTCSDGTEKNMVHLEYTPVRGRGKKLMDGWKIFKDDFDAYEAPAIEGEATEITEEESVEVEALPEVSFKLDGLAVVSNLEGFKEKALALVEISKQKIENSAQAEQGKKMVTMFKETEGKLDALKKNVLGEVTDIDAFMKDVDTIKETLRQARLNTEKTTKAYDEKKRSDLISQGEEQAKEYIGTMNEMITPFTIPELDIDFALAMKGKKTDKSLMDASAQHLADIKAQAYHHMGIVKSNKEFYIEKATGNEQLFPDIGDIIKLDSNIFENEVKVRLAEESERLQLAKQQQDALDKEELDNAAKGGAAPSQSEEPPLVDEPEQDSQDEGFQDFEDVEDNQAPVQTEAPVDKSAENAGALSPEELEHRRAINAKALSAFMEWGFNEQQSKTIVKLIIKGLIPNITIHY